MSGGGGDDDGDDDEMEAEGGSGGTPATWAELSTSAAFRNEIAAISGQAELQARAPPPPPPPQPVEAATPTAATRPTSGGACNLAMASTRRSE